MRDIEIIGLPFDGYGRAGHQAFAAKALRTAGLAANIAGLPSKVTDNDDLALPAFTTHRGEASGLINEPALVAMAEGVEARVQAALSGRRFPLVIGGDCSALLGIVPGVKHGMPQAGLLFVDGHEDSTPLDVSDGEAATSEIALLLGLAGTTVRGPLAKRIAVLDRDRIVMLGQRDAAYRLQFGLMSLRKRGVWLRDHTDIATDAGGVARQAVSRFGANPWWLHTDLDVLDPEVFPAQGLPEIEDEPGGLTWEQMTALLKGAIAAGGCVGWSIAIYDPAQDSDGSGARHIVELVNEVLGVMPAD